MNKEFRLPRAILGNKNHDRIEFEVLCHTNKYKCPRCGVNSWGYASTLPDDKTYKKYERCTECHEPYIGTWWWYWSFRWHMSMRFDVRVWGKYYIFGMVIDRRIWSFKIKSRVDKGHVCRDVDDNIGWYEERWGAYWLFFFIGVAIKTPNKER